MGNDTGVALAAAWKKLDTRFDIDIADRLALLADVHAWLRDHLG